MPNSKDGKTRKPAKPAKPKQKPNKEPESYLAILDTLDRMNANMKIINAKLDNVSADVAQIKSRLAISDRRPDPTRPP